MSVLDFCLNQFFCFWSQMVIPTVQSGIWLTGIYSSTESTPLDFYFPWVFSFHDTLNTFQILYFLLDDISVKTLRFVYKHMKSRLTCTDETISPMTVPGSLLLIWTMLFNNNIIVFMLSLDGWTIQTFVGVTLGFWVIVTSFLTFLTNQTIWKSQWSRILLLYMNAWLISISYIHQQHNLYRWLVKMQLWMSVKCEYFYNVILILWLISSVTHVS